MIFSKALKSFAKIPKIDDSLGLCILPLYTLHPKCSNSSGTRSVVDQRPEEMKRVEEKPCEIFGHVGEDEKRDENLRDADPLTADEFLCKKIK